MDAETRELLTNYVKDCDKNGMFNVCQKAQTQNGIDFLVQRLYELMDLYKDWTPAQCLSQLEVELSEQENQ